MSADVFLIEEMQSLIYPAPRPFTCKSIFFVSSPYHVLLAHILAAGESSSSDSILVMKEKRPHFFTMFNSIRTDKNIPFGQVYFLREPATGKRNKSAKHLKYRAREAGHLVQLLQPQKIYIFNDTYLEQFLIHEAKKLSATTYYVEDGAIAYSSHRKPIPWWIHLKNRLIFGNHFRQSEIEGIATNVDYIMAAYPQHVRKEIRSKRILELPKAVDNIFSNLNWPHAFLSSLNETGNHRYDSLYVFGYSGLFKHNRQYASVLAATVEQTRNTHYSSAVKYHPREKHQDYLALAKMGIHVLHSSVPAEILYYTNRNNLKIIYGDIGTSLITARWFLPHAKVVSFMERVQIEDQPFQNLLHEIGVDMW